jgi:glycosyltransferase involved in cell wall biosynthesis
VTASHTRLRANAAFFRLLEQQALRAADRQQWGRAVLGTQAASEFASKCHPGQFVSLPLESALDSAAQALLRSDGVRPPSGGGSIQDVLHVMTKTPFPGGHTSWVRRWVEKDAARTHSLVVTEESVDDVASDLRSAIALSGGEVLGLDKLGDPVAGAAVVRRMSGEHDAVIVSTHPWDVVPSLAFSFSGRRPVIRLDHADHRFWIGCGVSDVIVEYRSAGERCSRIRRGIAAQRLVFAPLPMNVASTPAGAANDEVLVVGDEDRRAKARRRLGIEPGSFVLLSVGAAYKFKPMNGLGYLEYVVPAVRALPRLLVIAVGPAVSRAWTSAGASTGPPNRLRAVGSQRVLDPYLDAADAFLNPIPIGSETAMWEAAMAGLPIICVRPAGDDLALVTSDPEDFGGAALAPDSPQALLSVVSRLCSDPEQCRKLGSAARQVALTRSGTGWQSSAERVYEMAQALGPASVGELSPDAHETHVDEMLSTMRTSSPLRMLAASEIRAQPVLSRAARSVLNATSRWHSFR